MTSAVWTGLSTYPQEEIDHASSGLSPAFSSELLQAEQRIGVQRQLDEVELPLDGCSRCPLLVTGWNDRPPVWFFAAAAKTGAAEGGEE